MFINLSGFTFISAARLQIVSQNAAVLLSFSCMKSVDCPHRATVSPWSESKRLPRKTPLCPHLNLLSPAGKMSEVPSEIQIHALDFKIQAMDYIIQVVNYIIQALNSSFSAYVQSFWSIHRQVLVPRTLSLDAYCFSNQSQFLGDPASLDGGTHL